MIDIILRTICKLSQTIVIAIFVIVLTPILSFFECFWNFTKEYFKDISWTYTHYAKEIGYRVWEIKRKV